MPRSDIIAEVSHLKAYPFFQNTYIHFAVLAQLYANIQQNLKGNSILFSFTMPSSASSRSVQSPLKVSGYGLGHTFHEEQVQPWSATMSPATLKHEEDIFWTARQKSNGTLERTTDMVHLETYHWKK